jgi:hypothetical protein
MGIYDGRSDRRRLTGFLSGIRLTNDRTPKGINDEKESLSNLNDSFMGNRIYDSHA